MFNKVALEKLTLDGFRPFGSFFTMDGIGSSDDLCPFFPDCARVGLQSEAASISYAVSYPRQMRIEKMEAHSDTQEGVIALSGETAFFVCPSDAQGEPLLAQTRAFLIPENTFLVLNTNVWHLAAFPLEDRPTILLCVLPEKTYLKDCRTHALSPDERMEIVFEHGVSPC